MINMKNNISTTLFCTVQHTTKRGVTVKPTTAIYEDILGHFLFDKEDIEEKKELLFAIWKRGQRQMKII